MNQFKVDVTKTHIQNGRVGNKCHCPVAVAMWSMGYEHINISDRKIVFWDNNNCYEAATPAAVQNWIRRYDNREEVAPFQFVLKYR